MNLNAEPKIIGMANALDLGVEHPADAIIEYCRKRVATFLRRAGRILNVAELQKIICTRLNLIVHEIWSDEDVSSIAEQYLAEDELAAFGALKSQLKPDTFGMILQLNRKTANGRARFVAFIDCRGYKAPRRVFTLWHEIAHCLTAREQMALPLRRTTADTIEKDPVEKLTDIIAGDFAFYEPLFLPVLNSEIAATGRLTFRVVERVRDRFNPDASFASTLNACVNKSPSPVIFLEAGLALKKADQRLVDSGLASASDFRATLRVLRSTPNTAARNNLPHIPKQMRVPSASVIARIESSPLFVEDTACENLSSWETSSGGRLAPANVVVEARRSGDRVIALITQAAA